MPGLPSNTFIVMTEKIKEQILAVRATGRTNMFDTNRVQIIANEMKFYELLVFIEEHKGDYAKFILTGAVLRLLLPGLPSNTFTAVGFGLRPLCATVLTSVSWHQKKDSRRNPLMYKLVILTLAC